MRKKISSNRTNPFKTELKFWFLNLYIPNTQAATQYSMLTTLLLNCICFFSGFAQQTPINRQALVKRHTVVVTQIDTLASLSVGNGKFAFTTDVTGLQTFPDVYAKGVPLGTQSEWGWHSFPNDGNYQIEETLKYIDAQGRKIPYAVQLPDSDRKKKAANYLRQNPHRLQLGNLGFELLKKDGSKALPSDIQNINQQLNMWTGEIHSRFSIEGVFVDVLTYAHQQKDVVAVKVKSDLLKTGQLSIRLRFPFPTDQFTDVGNNWKNADKHRSEILSATKQQVTITHTLDDTRHFVSFKWRNTATLSATQIHDFALIPDKKSDVFEFSCQFFEKQPTQLPTFSETQANSIAAWKSFWSRGGAVDFSGSTDPRANELERRIVLSQYLTKIQCAGVEPPQETGLTYNSWYGKPHLEMHWWHGVHFALWNRIDLLEQSLGWYAKVSGEAKEIAKRQGFKGVRWQKMTDPAGNEAPSSVGAYLIWQQPHFITFAELAYRQHPNSQTLEKYKDLVFATADFMASYAYFDQAKGRYMLGKGLIPAQECFKPEDTYNPTYELAYWHWALTVAQRWRERLHLPLNSEWDEVLNKLSPLPQKDGFYLATESTPDSYTNPAVMIDHPAVLGALGMLPQNERINAQTMQNTFNKIWEVWHWDHTWGWDFPLAAMTATRLGMPEKAIDALLMNIKTNTYLPNGHNFQDDRLRIYLPGNGGVLAAVALMCAGYDGCTTPNPGIPKNEKWKVRWEGLKKMP